MVSGIALGDSEIAVEVRVVTTKKRIKQLASLAGWLLLTVCLPWSLWWFRHIPPVGRGGLLLAFVATVMPLVWDEVHEIGRAGLILTLVVLFAVEYRAIDRERKDYAEEQKTARTEEREGFDKLLDKQQAGVQAILDRQDKNVKGILEQEQRHFERTLNNLVVTRRQDEHDFANLLTQEHELFTQQSNTLEFLTGKLLPASDPTPAVDAFCRAKPDDTVLFIGDEPHVIQRFPHTILIVNSDQVIAIDKLPSGALVLTINIKAADGKIVMRLDKRGLLIPNNRLFMLRPDASTLVVQDEYGKDVLNARYLNPHAFRIEPTTLPIRGKLLHIPMGMGSCMSTAYGDIMISY